MLGLLNLHAWSRASRDLIVKRNLKDRMPRLNQDNNNGKANKAKQTERVVNSNICLLYTSDAADE